jgi:hypothetical protein
MATLAMRANVDAAIAEGFDRERLTRHTMAISKYAQLSTFFHQQPKKFIKNFKALEHLSDDALILEAIIDLTRKAYKQYCMNRDDYIPQQYFELLTRHVVDASHNLKLFKSMDDLPETDGESLLVADLEAMILLTKGCDL